MTDGATSNPFIPLVGSAIGLLGTLIGTWVTWRKEANQEARRIHLLDQASKELLILEARLRIAALCLEPQQLAAVKLQCVARADEITSEVEACRRNVAVGKAVPRHSIFRRIFLLYTPNRPVTWFPRACYWIALLWLFFTELLPVPGASLILVFKEPAVAGLYILVEFGPALFFYWLNTIVDAPVSMVTLRNRTTTE